MVREFPIVIASDLLGMFVAVALIMLAMLLTPHYNVATQFLSETGVGPAAPLFSAAMLMLGVLLIPFFLSLRGFTGHSPLTSAGTALGLAACAGLMGLGLFNLEAVSLHYFFAGVFFVLMAFTMVLLSLELPRDMRFARRIGFLAAFFDALFLAALLTNTPVINTVLQKVAVGLIGAWVLTLNLRMLGTGKGPGRAIPGTRSRSRFQPPPCQKCL